MKKELRARLQATADEIVEILAEKDDAYGSSWKSKGGFSAFFQLDRKYSRIEQMTEHQGYDVFKAMTTFPDGTDTLKDLIGYALLILSETYEPPSKIFTVRGCAKMLETRATCGSVLFCEECEGQEPGREYVDQ